MFDCVDEEERWNLMNYVGVQPVVDAVWEQVKSGQLDTKFSRYSVLREAELAECLITECMHRLASLRFSEGYREAIEDAIRVSGDPQMLFEDLEAAGIINQEGCPEISNGETAEQVAA